PVLSSSPAHVPTRPSLSSFSNDPATTDIYTLSLHDALPISSRGRGAGWASPGRRACRHCSNAFHLSGHDDAGSSFALRLRGGEGDRKSTRLNSSHVKISYAVFCLKKKKQRYQSACVTRRRNG